MAVRPPNGDPFDKYYYTDPSGNKSCIFGWMRPSFFLSGCIPEWLPNDGLPIVLSRGKASFGAIHIVNGHSYDWLDAYKLEVAEAVWTKLSQKGDIHQGEHKGAGRSELCLFVNTNPRGMLMLEYKKGGKNEVPHLSVTTLYDKKGAMSGPKIGNYREDPSLVWRRAKKMGVYAEYPAGGFGISSALHLPPPVAPVVPVGNVDGETLPP